MRATWVHLGRDRVRDIALVCLAVAVVGASFGAVTVGSGLPVWLPVVMSVVVFAGAAQFLFVGILAAGGSPVAAVLAGLLVNARHLPFGLALGPVIGGRAAERVFGSYLLIDESVAFTLAEPDDTRRRAVYWTSAVGLFLGWNAGVLVGALGGNLVGDTDVLGLDAAFPAALLALILPALREPAARRAAITGAVLAVALSPLLPPGLPVLLALAGLSIGLLPPRDSDR
ncbi:AzlC family ABC transporter permease [Nakamurella flavida]|uniref:AzlC family ABC transporter permease n=1 Tax=Nakamurella flavida TaxID=363630 RepID=A0A938YJP7_9ACTN|nr:AzlC family ABC transporter permease [Nakamurella flavida]MBM9477232.1 AzlC family ABC transporter permease [Nakamurella flavida]MDP9780182.1 4-azaleucine resistance transporter AzlC [Nakamurella flavida]